MNRAKTVRAVIGYPLLLALLLGVAALEARVPSSAPKVQAQQVTTQALEGYPDKEIDIRIYTFPPDTSVPWHIHKDSVEIAHTLEGSVMLEEQGKQPLEIAVGQTNILLPNVVHRGWNPSKTEPARLYVVRLKPKGAPLATLVPPPVKSGEAPVDKDYPEE